ncbi:MAG TPA: PQQ-dependent sugar dehydrogenase [Chryseosolibacter sp.]|nr:PQQ-dependent sugar dehydrogenase [Chryseosolibacter sp.]
MLTLRFSFIAVCFVLGCSRPEGEESTQPDDGSRPDDNRFTPVVVTPEGALNEPMVFEVVNDKVAYIIERHGAIKKVDIPARSISQVGEIAVFTENEQGLVGFTLDPDFKSNRFVYIYYAHPTESKFLFTRWELRDSLITSSEKMLFEIPCDRVHTSHTGGGMAWDESGNLYITIGNNTGNSLYSQTDQQPGHAHYDDQRGAANTNDLRGKILRIHPEPDGTYSIPEGNLFKPGTPGTRPEIFAMGNRNPWRIHVDSKTGFVYWGEIGPDADSDSERGPMGYDELNQARKPGFFGWPYFIGENHAYPMYDYATNIPGEKQDPKHPVNNSVNNTGIKELPPAQPAFISYPYRSSEKFPLVGSSSRCAIGGPVFRRRDFDNPVRPFPKYYEGKWLAADLSRFWIMAISMNDEGDYIGMERFVPSYHPAQPIDIKFAPTGDLYVLEYGSNTVNSAVESRLVRIEYNAGNRKPFVVLNAENRSGAIPFTAHFNGDKTIDYDGDKLSFDWVVTDSTNARVAQSDEPNFEYTFTEAGVFTVVLMVTDPHGETNSKEIKIVAGNAPPEVDLRLTGNQDFFFDNNTVQYRVNITDAEDGSLELGSISPASVSVSIDYASYGFDYVDITLGHSSVDALTRFAVAETMISKTDCKTCHHVDVKGIGPSFVEISERYKGNPRAAEYLGGKIKNGSSGIWGKEVSMPAHPTLTEADASTIANYILNITSKETKPVKGAFSTFVPNSDNGRGTFIFRAAYRDNGNGDLPSLASEDVIILKSPVLLPVEGDTINGAIRDHLDEYTFLTGRPNSYVVFNNLHLTDISSILVRPNWHLYDIYRGGQIEVRVDRVDGPLIGSATMKPEQFNMRYRRAFGGLDDPEKRKLAESMNLPFLDQSKFFAPGANKNMFTIPSLVTLQKISGRHNLYFIFRNDDASREESLFPLAEFVLQSTPQK